jgi:hypothetical protein
MPLTNLFISGTLIQDLSRIKHHKLKALGISGTKVSDLGPIRHMALEYLGARACPLITNFDAISRMALRSLTFDYKSERDIPLLKSIPTLERINDISRSDFWKKHGISDGNQGDPTAPSGWTSAVDLLPLVDLSQDSPEGGWKWEAGALISPKEITSTIWFPYTPPKTYEFRLELTWLADVEGATLRLQNDSPFYFSLGFHHGTGAGFGRVGEKMAHENPTTVRTSDLLKPGFRHCVVVRVHADQIATFLDDRPLTSWQASMGPLKAGNWSRLGISTEGHASHFKVHSARVLELEGKGRLTR